MKPEYFLKKWFHTEVGAAQRKTDLDSVIAAAVSAERERCAKVAYSIATNETENGVKRGAQAVAAALRALK